MVNGFPHSTLNNSVQILEHHLQFHHVSYCLLGAFVGSFVRLLQCPTYFSSMVTRTCCGVMFCAVLFCTLLFCYSVCRCCTALCCLVRLGRTLRRAIWVVILEQKQESGTCTHAFFLRYKNPYTPFPPYFVTISPFLGLLPLQMVHLLPIPNMEWAVYEMLVVPALGTLETTRVR